MASGTVDSLMLPPPPPPQPPASRGAFLAGLLAFIALGISGAGLILTLVPPTTPTPLPPATEAAREPTFDVAVLTQAAESLEITLAAAVNTVVDERLSALATQTASVPTATVPPTITPTPTGTPTPVPAPTLSITPTPPRELVITPLQGAGSPFAYVGSIRGLSLAVYTLNQEVARTVTLNASYGGFVLLPAGMPPDYACSLETQNPLESVFEQQPLTVIYCAPEQENLRNPVTITARDDAGRIGSLTVDLRRDVLSLRARQIATALEPAACPYAPAADADTPPLNVVPFVFRLVAQDATPLPRSYHVSLNPLNSFQVYNPGDNCRAVGSEAIFAMLDSDLIAYYVLLSPEENRLPRVTFAAAGDTPTLTGDAFLDLQPIMVALFGGQILVLSEPDTTSPPLALPLADDTRRLRKGQSLIIIGQREREGFLLVATNQGTGYVRNFPALVGIVGDIAGVSQE